MRYWMALVYLRDNLTLNQPQHLALTVFTHALACTRRNAQLVIKRLAAEQVIHWQAGIGRGNLAQITLLKSVDKILAKQAQYLLSENKVEQAITLVPNTQRDNFLAGYIAQYQHQEQQDILKIPFYRGTHSLDPININRRTEQHIANYLYAKLLNFDVVTQSYHGDLAAHWQLHSNCFSVTLRKQLRFHDNSPLTAVDVSKHFQRLIQSNNNNAQIYQQINRVEVITPLQINFYSDSIANAIPKLLSLSSMAISKLTEQGLVGSGSFKLTTQNQWLTRLTAFEHYHGYRPWIDAVDIWNIGDKTKDFNQENHLHHAKSGYHQQEGFNTLAQWETGAEYLLINSQSPWGKQLQQRQALMVIIQSVGLPKAILEDDVAYATSMVSTPNADNVRQAMPLIAQQTIDIALGDIQHADKPIAILTYQLEQHITYAQHLCQQLNRLGIKATYEVLEFPEFDTNAALSQADIIISGEVFGQNTEMSWLDWLYSSRALTNCLTPKAKLELQQQVLATLQMSSLKQRLNSFCKIESALMNQQIYLPLFHVKQSMNVSAQLSMAELLANGWIDFNTVVLKPA